MQTQCKHSADLLHTNSKPSTRASARSKVEETLDHGTVAVHAKRPSIAVHLVQLHLDTEEEHHSPVPAILQGGVKLGAGSLGERGRGDAEDVVHLHLLMVDTYTH
jgi:hypothetical protein